MRQTRFPHLRGARGIGILELVVVVMIVALAAAILLPDTRQSLATIELAASAKQIAFTLDLARAKAIALNTQARVVFDSADERFATQVSEAGNWQTIGSHVLPQALDLRTSGTAVFNSDGTAQSALAIFLSNFKNEAHRITVSRAGGVSSTSLLDRFAWQSDEETTYDEYPGVVDYEEATPLQP